MKADALDRLIEEEESSLANRQTSLPAINSVKTNGGSKFSSWGKGQPNVQIKQGNDNFMDEVDELLLE